MNLDCDFFLFFSLWNTSFKLPFLLMHSLNKPIQFFIMSRHILHIFIEMNYATSCLSSCRIANVQIYHIIEIGVAKCISSLKWNRLQSNPSQKKKKMGLAFDLKRKKKKEQKQSKKKTRKRKIIFSFEMAEK